MPEEKNAKPGWKTSEFWLTIAVLIAGGLMASGAFEDGGTVSKILAVVLSLGGALGYTAARVFTKNAEAKAVDGAALADVLGTLNQDKPKE